MDVYKFDIKKNIKEQIDKSILLLGEFEVFHNGHNELLKKANKIKQDEKIGIFLIIKKEKDPFQTLENKLNNFASLGFDFVVVAEFDFEFKTIDGKDFIKYLERNFNVKTFIVGADFKFGKDRKYGANDINKISSTNVEIIDILKYDNLKISSSDIKQMHEFGEYNVINKIIVNPLVFDVQVFDKIIKWGNNVVQPHFGNYYFQILIDDYWYSGIINFSISKTIQYVLINYDNKKEIFNQKTKIKIIDLERIITNQRYDNITNDDIEKTKIYFSI